MASHLALEVRGMVLAVLEVRLSKNISETRVTTQRWKNLEEEVGLSYVLVKNMTNEKEASKP
jgi:hypothetical protein